MKQRKQTRVDMTTGAITPKLVTLAWPLVAGNLLQTAYNLADLFWVGRVSSSAIAAVSLVFPTAWLLISLGMGVTVAAVALVSQHIGAGQQRKADQVTAQSVILALGLAIVLAAIGYIFRHQYLDFLGAKGDVYTQAMDYIVYIFFSIPFTFLFFAFRAVLRAAGDTRIAMWLVLLSAGVNMVLDPFLITGLGPIPAMGTGGAALATLISRALAAAAGLYVLVSGDWGVQLRWQDLKPDWPILKRLASIGYPATLDGGARSFSAVAMVALVSRFGATATAAYGIAIRLMSVTWTVSGAVGQAAATGVGQNLGARAPERSEEVAWKAMGADMAFLMALGVLVWIFPGFALHIFTHSQAVIHQGSGFLRIIALLWAFQGGLMVIQGGFRGAGSTMPAMVLSFMSRWVFRLPVAWLLAWPLGLGANGIWWGIAISGVLAFLAGAGWFKLGHWKHGVLDDEASEETTEAKSTGEAATS